MSRPTIVVVGLGPGDERWLTAATRDLLTSAPTARLRTRVHPAATAFAELDSYDDLYESAESFEDLYEAIADDLVGLAQTSLDGRVVYGVPGSPVVAERTVEMLVTRTDVDVIIEPAVSIIDAACAALRRDPMSCQLRVVDALSSDEPLRGPGPLLVLQTYATEVLAVLASRLAPGTPVTILHHVGLKDERLVSTTASELVTFDGADHLTSVWVESLRTAGDAIDDLVALTTTLRRECVWDQEQTHESLSRHLLEEAYETLDAIESYVASEPTSSGPVDPSHLVEELGDLLFQIAFHAELGREEGAFDFADVADHVRTKLIARHPHVFEGVRVENADDAARQWEELKRDEKQRTSVTDGIPMQLPSLTLYAKLRRKATSLGMVMDDGATMRERVTVLASGLLVGDVIASDGVVEREADPAWGELLSALSDLARWCGVDLEAVLRRRAVSLRDEILTFEAKKSSTPRN